MFTGRLLAATAVAEAVTAEIKVFLSGHAAHLKGLGDYLMDAILHLLDFSLSSEKVVGDFIVEEVGAQLLEGGDFFLGDLGASLLFLACKIRGRRALRAPYGAS